METRNRKEKNYQSTPRNLKRTILSQLVPLILMLFVGSWLALAAGKVIDQTRGESVSLSALEQRLGNRL